MPYLPITATLYRCEEIGEQRQTNGSQRHRHGSAQNPAAPSKSAVSPWYGDIDYELEYKDALAFLEVDYNDLSKRQ
jgi:hypothetical protein